jgi:hypothetical protein
MIREISGSQTGMVGTEVGFSVIESDTQLLVALYCSAKFQFETSHFSDVHS